MRSTKTLEKSLSNLITIIINRTEYFVQFEEGWTRSPNRKIKLLINPVFIRSTQHCITHTKYNIFIQNA